MDIVGSFSPSRGQNKFLIVVIDYFTKWIEAESLSKITTQQVKNFVWKNIIFRFGIPNTIMTENEKQFVDKTLAEFYSNLGIKHTLVQLSIHKQMDRQNPPTKSS